MPPEPNPAPAESAEPAEPAEDSGLRDTGFSATFAKSPAGARRGLLPGKRVWTAVGAAAAVTGLVLVTIPLVGSLEFGSDSKNTAAAESAASESRSPAPGQLPGAGTGAGQQQSDGKTSGGSAARPAGTGPGAGAGAGQQRYDSSGEYNPWGAAGGSSSGGGGGGSASGGGAGSDTPPAPPRGTGDTGPGPGSATGGGSGTGGGGSAGRPTSAPTGGATKPATGPKKQQNTPGPAPVATPRPPKLDDGKIKGPVMSFALGLCVDILGGKVTHGPSLKLAACSQEQRQRFEFRPDGQVWTLYQRKTCMEGKGGGTADGTPVRIADCKGNQAQVFRIQKDGSLVNPRTNKCVEPISQGSRGYQLQLHPCDGSKNQKWQIG
ncbi:RICIN domain-containing protein [Streptomyces sp. NPDC020875]|uniref:RICIN domain-containing protein n=1 Tax=Streptomyces sp. NPDC020875 TaxID=3154898 RepID=UPI0033FA7FBF